MQRWYLYKSYKNYIFRYIKLNIYEYYYKTLNHTIKIVICIWKKFTTQRKRNGINKMIQKSISFNQLYFWWNKNLNSQQWSYLLRKKNNKFNLIHKDEKYFWNESKKKKKTCKMNICLLLIDVNFVYIEFSQRSITFSWILVFCFSSYHIQNFIDNR